MHRTESLSAASIGDRSSFLSETQTMAALDDLEKGGQPGHGSSRPEGRSLEFASPTPTEAFNVNDREQDTEKSIVDAHDVPVKNVAYTGNNTVVTATGVACGPEDISDFPEGGFRAWSVVLGVSNDTHSVVLQLTHMAFLFSSQSCLLAFST
jgi:hypothetical protein